MFIKIIIWITVCCDRVDQRIKQLQFEIHTGIKIKIKSNNPIRFGAERGCQTKQKRLGDGLARGGVVGESWIGGILSLVLSQVPVRDYGMSTLVLL